MAREELQLTVMNRDRVLFSGPAISVSSVNLVGKFDVLPEHTNYISLIKEKVVIRLPGGLISEIPVTGGVMRVKEDRVDVLLGIGG